MYKNYLIKYVQDYALKRGEFTLSSGIKSSYYLDLKLAYTRPEVMNEIVFNIRNSIKGRKFDRVAGMELGAVPLAVALSLSIDIPFLIVRKMKKGYGANNRIEGEVLEGEQILLVEDVTTTGDSILSAARVIREAGGVCNFAVTVVDRLQKAKKNLSNNKILLVPLITIEDLGLLENG